MNCPSCGKEMETGSMTTGGRMLHWIPDDGFEQEMICGISLFRGTIPAYCCRSCRRLVVDYEKRKKVIL